MESVSRNVILDLLPVYLAGEASAETRELVEAFARHDAEIARLIQTGDLESSELRNISAPQEIEIKAVNKMRKSIRRQILSVAIGVAALLMIPLIAMQFTSEVQWTPFDFFAMGFLLTTAGLTYVFISRLRDSSAYRVGVAVAVITGFVLVWGNLAVGLIGSEDNPANQLYFGVLLLGVIVAAIGKFRPRGMMRALLATAIAQFLVPVLAIMIWKPHFTVDQVPGVIGVFILNSMFAFLFVVSALFFRRSSQTE
jgi:hypothetical protein